MTPLPRRSVLAGAAAWCAIGAPRRLSSQAPTIPPATIDEGLEIEGESLQARLARTRMSIGVLVDGHGPYRFTVDSGADRSVIALEVAQALALAPGAPVTLHSTTGTARAETVRIGTLRIGASEIHGIAAPALPMRYLGAEGLLGIDALADQRLMLDFDARRIVIQDSRRASAAIAADEIVVTARRRNGQLILTQASAGRVPVYGIIDSGSEVTMGNGALRDRLFARGRLPETTPVEIESVLGGVVSVESIVLRELTIGGITINDAPVAFYDTPPFALFGLARQPALLLGSDVLRAFSRVSLDFRARKVRFRLRR